MAESVKLKDLINHNDYFPAAGCARRPCLGLRRGEGYRGAGAGRTAGACQRGLAGGMPLLFTIINWLCMIMHFMAMQAYAI